MEGGVIYFNIFIHKNDKLISIPKEALEISRCLLTHLFLLPVLIFLLPCFIIVGSLL